MTQDIFRADVRRPETSTARQPSSISVERESNRLLSAAVMDGKLDLLRNLLVHAGHDPNARDDHGNTVGHQASFRG